MTPFETRLNLGRTYPMELNLACAKLLQAGFRVSYYRKTVRTPEGIEALADMDVAYQDLIHFIVTHGKFKLIRMTSYNSKYRSEEIPLPPVVPLESEAGTTTTYDRAKFRAGDFVTVMHDMGRIKVMQVLDRYVPHVAGSYSGAGRYKVMDMDGVIHEYDEVKLRMTSLDDTTRLMRALHTYTQRVNEWRKNRAYERV